MKRLDRYYYFRCPHGNPTAHIQRYEILGDCALSDHLLVLSNVELQPTMRTGSRYKINNYYLQDKHVVDQLGRVWRAQLPTLGFFGKF
jgi:hypothetical protein